MSKTDLRESTAKKKKKMVKQRQQRNPKKDANCNHPDKKKWQC